jgi:hypothetical protein
MIGCAGRWKDTDPRSMFVTQSRGTVCRIRGLMARALLKKQYFYFSACEPGRLFFLPGSPLRYFVKECRPTV